MVFLSFIIPASPALPAPAGRFHRVFRPVWGRGPVRGGWRWFGIVAEGCCAAAHPSAVLSSPDPDDPAGPMRVYGPFLRPLPKCRYQPPVMTAGHPERRLKLAVT